jgi:hypothetical protein
MHIYYPYPANNGKHKYYIITASGKKIFFGAHNYNDYLIYYKYYGKEYADKKKEAYLARHKVNEEKFWNNPNYPSFWSKNLLWNKPTLEASYNDIKKILKHIN